MSVHSPVSRQPSTARVAVRSRGRGARAGARAARARSAARGRAVRRACVSGSPAQNRKKILSSIRDTKQPRGGGLQPGPTDGVSTLTFSSHGQRSRIRSRIGSRGTARGDAEPETHAETKQVRFSEPHFTLWHQESRPHRTPQPAQAYWMLVPASASLDARRDAKRRHRAPVRKGS